MRNNIVLLLLLCIAAVSCRKGDLLKGNYNGELQLWLAQLPNTPNVDIYFDGKFVDTLVPSSNYSKFLFIADKAGNLEIKKRNSNEVILDTSIVIPREKAFPLRFAYNEDLGVRTWLAGSGIDPDSAKVQFYNSYPEAFVPADVELEAELFIERVFNTGEYTPYDIPLIAPFKHGKIFPTTFTLPARHEDGTGINYVLQVRNAVTKEPVKDVLNRDIISVGIGSFPGSQIIVSISAATFRGGYRFNNTYIEL